ncbi:HEPN domain-containing protein [Niabella sp. W65]|nr:HEPN domain-containing protein [Niabella sp. W65]MCH7365804.1 HEPN domain-containing protein [Niabella sp. W65]
MEQNCSRHHTVSCMVMQTSSFIRELHEKNAFAVTVVLNAPVIYNTNPQLEQWRKDVLAESTPPTGQAGFQKCITLFNEYMAGAQLFTVRKHYKLALFMYHQATELVLTAFIKAQTGLQLRIHNIHHLNQYLSFLAPQVAAGFFWGITQKEKDTFRLLQKSYCAARYEEGFEVEFKELEIVRENLSRLITWLRLGIEVV